MPLVSTYWLARSMDFAYATAIIAYCSLSVDEKKGGGGGRAG